LAALELLMSKQPRGRVRIGTCNTMGARTSNVFDDVEKFQARYEASSKNSKVSACGFIHIQRSYFCMLDRWTIYLSISC
jgi:hypothetical protein